MEIPSLGTCEFDEVYGCYRSKPMSLLILNGAKCSILLMDYEDDPNKDEFHQAIANFLTANRTVLVASEPHIFKYYLGVQESIVPEDDFPFICQPSEIWSFIQLGADAIVGRRPYGDKGIYISLECNCDWEPEHGLQIVFKNGCFVNKVGPYDGHFTNSDAFADSALEHVIYR